VILKTFVLVSLIPCISFSQNLPNCSDIYENQPQTSSKASSTKGLKCKSWSQSKSPVLARYSDGSILPNPKFTDNFGQEIKGSNSKTSLSSAMKSNKNKAEIKKIIERYKVLYKEKLLGDTRPEFYSADQKILAARIDKITIRFIDCPGQVMPSPTMSKEGEEIIMCEQGLNLPVESYIPIISHEMAHAMNPCMTDLFSYNKDTLEKIKSGQKLKKCRPSDIEQAYFENIELRTALDAYSSGKKGLFPYAKEKESVEKLVSCGLVSPPVNLRNDSFAGHPFAALNQCLSRQRTKPQPAKGNTSSTSFASSSQSKSALDKAGAFSSSCSGVQLEDFADHLGAEMTASYVLEHQKQIRPEQRENLLAYFSLEACREESEHLEGDHPPANHRVQVYLQQPAIQSLLNCEGVRTSKPCSFKNEGSSPSSEKATATR